MGKSFKLKNNSFLDNQSVYRHFQAYRGDNSGLNLDNFTTDGVYLLNECTNLIESPLGSVDGILEVDNIKNNGGFTFIIQKLYNRAPQSVYIRCFWFGVFWTQWKEL